MQPYPSQLLPDDYENMKLTMMIEMIASEDVTIQTTLPWILSTFMGKTSSNHDLSLIFFNIVYINVCIRNRWEQTITLKC